MNKTNNLATNFLKKAKQESEKAHTKILPQTQPLNTFDRMFEVKDLSEKDTKALERILTTNIEAKLPNIDSLEKDLTNLKQITKEIKAIGKQSLILLGNRIHKAKILLQNYKDSTFRQWLELTFGSVKSGYNIFAFYNFYHALPSSELKERLQDMPQKASYILASRDAPLEKKVEIIQKHGEQKTYELIKIIQETIPTKQNRAVRNSSLISNLEENCLALFRKKSRLSLDERKKIAKIIQILEQII